MVQTPSQIKKLLARAGMEPKKSLGQNFLVSERVVKEMTESARLDPSERVLEIGPGLGALTEELARRVKKVTAVEKDGRLAELLRQRMESFSNVEIVKRDFLDNPSVKITSPYKVVSNLPFNVSKRVIRVLLEAEEPPLEMVLIVQKEVAQSVCARPPRMDLLSAAVQFYAEAEFLKKIPRSAFWPQPEVEAGLVRLERREREYENKDLFFKLVRAGFRHRRKQLRNNLCSTLALEKEEVVKWLKRSKVSPRARAETLGIKEWINLTKKYKDQWP